MNSDPILACLGRSEADPEVQRLLADLGVKKKLKMPRDDIEARVNLPKQGLSLVFKPSGPTNGALFFQAAQFFSSAEPGYAAFTGSLPMDLGIGDTQAEVRARLGRPTASKPRFRLDTWTQGTRVLTVEYAREDGRIAAVTVHVPAPG